MRLLHLLQNRHVTIAVKGENETGAAGPASPAGAVQVVGDRLGEVKVDYVADSWDV